jgi:long-chain acyl-CoA synthetase
MPDGQGVEVYAVLVPDKGVTDHDRIIRQANAHLAPHQYIKGFTTWPEQDFPRTHTLKVKKHEVLARILKMKEGKEDAATSAAMQEASRK